MKVKTLDKNLQGVSEPFSVPLNSKKEFNIFNSLQAYRLLHFKDRKYFTLRIPAIFINGYASNRRVSITPAVCENKAYLIVGLTETQAATGGDAK